AGLVGFLSLAAIFLAARWSPVRAARRRMATQAPSRLAGAAAASGVPAPAVVGLRFALEPEAGGDVVPVRSAIIGATLALGVLMATVTFGASLDTLVSTPRLYGWNWDAALPSGGDIPQARAAQLLDHDPFVAHWSGYNYGLLAVGGTLTPVLGATPEAAVGPPLLSGHGVERSDEVVLGSITMTALHKHLGDWVTVSSLGGPAARLHIVGRATLPTLGNSGLEHTEMGSGALLDDRLIPESQRNLFANPLAGPQVVFVNFTAGANRAAAERSLGPIAGALSNTSNFGVGVQLTPVYPAEIVNYRTMGTTPALLSGGLAAGAVAALVLTLAASVRRRRREFALLKCLGCTGSQVRAAVACQSSVSVAIGALVGTPLGIVVGRYLWDLFANEIHAVPAPAVPALEIAVIVAAGLVLANVVAALPGRVAARIPAAVLLRAD
ncbi:MAG TPA: FtsX-like permease family protein, partial [Acidimicrobiales bacterium]|nr:FtsX-like permease family protein [Acidimicrobiales bacterium]